MSVECAVAPVALAAVRASVPAGLSASLLQVVPPVRLFSCSTWCEGAAAGGSNGAGSGECSACATASQTRLKQTNLASRSARTDWWVSQWAPLHLQACSAAALASKERRNGGEQGTVVRTMVLDQLAAVAHRALTSTLQRTGAERDGRESDERSTSCVVPLAVARLSAAPPHSDEQHAQATAHALERCCRG